jgi:hypothetical protein
LGARIGFTAVLHTWGSALTDHPHVHVIVPGGGLSPDGIALDHLNRPDNRQCHRRAKEEKWRREVRWRPYSMPIRISNDRNRREATIADRDGVRFSAKPARAPSGR